MGEAVLALGTGVVQGMAGRKQQSEKDEYFKAQKKLLNAQVDMEQRKASMFEKLPPEEQARVLFGQAPTSKADELKGIFDLLGGAQGGPPAAEPPMDTGPFPTTMGGPITLPGGDLIDTMAGMKTEGMMPAAPGGPGGLNIPPGMEGIVNSLLGVEIAPKVRPQRFGNVGAMMDDFGNVKSRFNLPVKGEKFPFVDPTGAERTGMRNPFTGEWLHGTGPGQGGAVKTKSTPGLSAEAAGKMQGAKAGLRALSNFKGLLLNPNGGIDRKLVFSMSPMGSGGSFGVPGTPGYEAFVYLKDALESKIRIESGAAVPPSEIKRLMERYRPNPLWTDDLIMNQVNSLEEFLNGTIRAIDPEDIYGYDKADLLEGEGEKQYVWEPGGGSSPGGATDADIIFTRDKDGNVVRK